MCPNLIFTLFDSENEETKSEIKEGRGKGHRRGQSKRVREEYVKKEGRSKKSGKRRRVKEVEEVGLQYKSEFYFCYNEHHK